MARRVTLVTTDARPSIRAVDHGRRQRGDYVGRYWRSLSQPILFPIFAVLLATAANANPAELAREEIRAALQRWTATFNTGDARHVCDIFAEDLIAQYQGQPDRNHEQLCDLLIKSVNDKEKNYRYALQIQEIIVSGDLAVVRLVWTLEVISSTGPPQIIDEPGIDIFRRQADGTWKIARYISYGTPR